mmetsp:Transcript_12383/g.12428  ORF Transcript_12383/g.12428 Transcript_12383/m.12428 type:complete len:128 (-) Transcript_12383:22-405(-)
MIAFLPSSFFLRTLNNQLLDLYIPNKSPRKAPKQRELESKNTIRSFFIDFPFMAENKSFRSDFAPNPTQKLKRNPLAAFTQHPHLCLQKGVFFEYQLITIRLKFFCSLKASPWSDSSLPVVSRFILI